MRGAVEQAVRQRGIESQLVEPGLRCQAEPQPGGSAVETGIEAAIEAG